MSDFLAETDDMLRGRVDSAWEAMDRNLRRSLYGDDEPAKPISYTRRAMNWVSVRYERSKEAWLVLTGKASIGY